MGRDLEKGCFLLEKKKVNGARPAMQASRRSSSIKEVGARSPLRGGVAGLRRPVRSERGRAAQISAATAIRQESWRKSRRLTPAGR